MSIYLIAEIGHNHNGDFGTALRMVDEAAKAGADAVKIQVRTLPDAIPVSQRNREKVVPWTGERMSYVDYRRLCEFTEEQIDELSERTKSLGMDFGASTWDGAAVGRALLGGLDFLKVASASTTDSSLLLGMAVPAADHGIPLLVSTGGCTWDDVDRAMAVCEEVGCETWLAQCTSTYPTPPDDINLLCIPEMVKRYPWARVGFSNHAVSIVPAVAAVALGATWVEVHVTLDRSMPGTDQAASFEFEGLRRLRSYAETARRARGSSVKVPTPGEVEIMKKLRRVE